MMFSVSCRFGTERRKLLGNKDIAEKFLENYNDVFSDIVNNLVFDGACVVDEKDLEQAGTRSAYRG